MPHRDLDVLDAAENAVTRVNTLIDGAPRRILYVSQLRRSAQSVVSNIGEGFGHPKGALRDSKLETAKGEAEETMKALRSNFKSARVDARTYWPLMNRYQTIVKMLDSMLNR